MLSNYASCLLLNTQRGKMRFVDILYRKVFEFWHPMPDEVGFNSIHIEARFSIRTWVVEPKIGHGKRSNTRKPQPVRIIKSPVTIQKLMIKNIAPVLPMLPKLSACQKTRNGMPTKVMHPSSGVQLPHKSID